MPPGPGPPPSSLLQLSWLQQLGLQVPKPAQLKVQPPPVQLKVQLAPCSQVIWQFPPSHSALQVDWPLHVKTQPPPTQCELQLAVPAQ